MTAHPFLSDDWINAAEAIHAEFADRTEALDEVVRLNITVRGVPFGSGELEGHIDTSAGNTIPKWGFLDNPQASITVPYEVARSLFVTLDFEEVIMSFMSGQIEVEGDITRLMFLQELSPSPAQHEVGEEVARRLQAITI